jgi:hypothetical protein
MSRTIALEWPYQITPRPDLGKPANLCGYNIKEGLKIYFPTAADFLICFKRNVLKEIMNKNDLHVCENFFKISPV